MQTTLNLFDDPPAPPCPLKATAAAPETVPGIDWDYEAGYIQNYMDRTGMAREAVHAMLNCGKLTPHRKEAA